MIFLLINRFRTSFRKMKSNGKPNGYDSFVQAHFPKLFTTINWQVF